MQTMILFFLSYWMYEEVQNNIYLQTYLSTLPLGRNLTAIAIGGTYFGRFYVGDARRTLVGPLVNRRREATTYYHRDGPIGQIMGKWEWFPPRELKS